MITIYGLTDEHGQIRYVGVTNDPAVRFKWHTWNKYGKDFNIAGMAVLSRVVDEDRVTAQREEQRWIDYFGMDNLFNVRTACQKPDPPIGLPDAMPLTPQSMGRLGGLARAKTISQEKRTEIARLGGLARQKKAAQP